MFEKHKRNIARAVKFARQDLAEETAKVLINISPITSGVYVKSFTVGITKQSLGNNPASEPIKPELPAAAKAALRSAEKNKLIRRARGLATRFTSKIISFGNMAGHATQVEKIGWTKTPPYHVFSRTTLIIENRKKKIAAQAKARAFKT